MTIDDQHAFKVWPFDLAIKPPPPRVLDDH
jgi:hypothetical protein